MSDTITLTSTKIEVNVYVWECPLPEKGYLRLNYRLAERPSKDSPTERDFQTQDTTALELTLTNVSDHNLKHIHISNLRIVEVLDGGKFREVTEKLPNGNLFFELIPTDTYFGALAPNAEKIKYLSLITRGVHEAQYAVIGDVNYDIEQFTKPIGLNVKVGAD
jgi:hypothetical protein